MAKIQELRDLGDDELFARLDADKEELFNLRFQLATGQLDNPMRIKHVRHEVARILTILGERDLEAEMQAYEAQAASSAGAAEVPAVGSGEEVEATEGGSSRRRFRRQKETEAS